MQRKRLSEIAVIIDGEVVGDEDIYISGICGIKEAKDGDITFLANPKYAPLMKETKASAIITSFDIESAPKPIIRTKNPSLAFTKLIQIFSPVNIRHPKGIDKSAFISDTAMIGKDVAVGAHAYISNGVQIKDATIIYAGTFIGEDSKIGRNSLVYPNVTIRENVTIQDRVIIHSGTVIGSDGFGYESVEGVHHKIPQIGTVVVEDDVEIGANVAIDRARFGKTIIGAGTKIDNLVHVAHNVVIGKNCIIVAQVGISGSTTLGDNVVLAGQVGTVGHITIGDNAIVMAQSGVSKSVPANTHMFGYPARPLDEAKRINAAIGLLPKLYDKVKKLEKEISELKEKMTIEWKDKKQ